MQNTLAVISLKRIRENAEIIKRAAGAPLIAVIKDDAYGHGAERVAHALFGIADAFAVSTVDEGAALRCAGVREDILVLTPPLDEEETIRLSYYDLIASISSFFVLKKALAAVRTEKLTLRAHLVINTGMNRYGFLPEKLGEALKRTRELQVEGVYSHLYLPSSETCLREQARLFEKSVSAVKEVYPDAVSHLAATGGILAGVKTDMARAGISLYGYLPEGFGNALEVKPALKVYAAVAQNGRTTGRGFGYGLNEEGAEKSHTLRFGYGDGFFRAGKLCMDACVVKGAAKTGRRKLIFKDAAAYARLHGTTEYEALVNVTKRAEKRYDG